jgi:hypothetical protein
MMTMRTKQGAYLAVRCRFEPDDVRLVVVAESPPASGLYFYNPQGKVSEPLFAALMAQLGFAAATKEDGLREFQRRGWLLIDATYEPVNRLTRAGRNKVIERDYPLLCKDLAKLIPDRSTPLILIKANVCRLLEPKLVRDEFNVLNRGCVVPFPSSGWQAEFRKKFVAILRSAGDELVGRRPNAARLSGR